MWNSDSWLTLTSVCVCALFYIAQCANSRMRAGRNNPPNPIRDKDKYVDVNFYQLIVLAPVFIKYLLKTHDTIRLLRFHIQLQDHLLLSTPHTVQFQYILSVLKKFRNYT